MKGAKKIFKIYRGMVIKWNGHLKIKIDYELNTLQVNWME